MAHDVVMQNTGSDTLTLTCSECGTLAQYAISEHASEAALRVTAGNYADLHGRDPRSAPRIPARPKRAPKPPKPLRRRWGQ